MATQKNIQLNLSVQPNLGAIAVDERRMRQALINLLSNAVKFTASGGQVCLEVKLVKAETTSLPATTELHNAIVFSVTDTGIGIAPEDISKLFQTFVQIDSSLSRQYAGTGLGLTLVKQIAELHNGYATVTSQVGEGSCFSIFLPYTGKIRSNNVDISSYSDSQNVSQRDKIDGITVNRSEKNFEVYVPVNPLILLAEDSQANIETFSDYLSNRGYRLIFAANGQEAIDMAIAHLPALILMDIQMPVLDGFGAIEQIRANPDLRHIPIVALTAHAMDSDREKCLQAGVNDYLSKPVKLSKLATIIQHQLQNSKNSKDEDSPDSP
jgi:CheY-like chemotaxis protein